MPVEAVRTRDEVVYDVPPGYGIGTRITDVFLRIAFAIGMIVTAIGIISLLMHTEYQLFAGAAVVIGLALCTIGGLFMSALRREITRFYGY